jgi:hypothetical protein
VVTRQAFNQDCRLFDQAWIRLVVAERGARRRKGRVGQPDIWELGDLLRINAETSAAMRQ